MDDDLALVLALAILKYPIIHEALVCFECKSSGKKYQDRDIETFPSFVTFLLRDIQYLPSDAEIATQRLVAALRECYTKTKECYEAAVELYFSDFEEIKNRYDEIVVAHKGGVTEADECKCLSEIVREADPIKEKLKNAMLQGRAPSDFVQDDWSIFLSPYKAGVEELDSLCVYMRSAMARVDKVLRENERIRLAEKSLKINIKGYRWAIIALLIGTLVGLFGREVGGYIVGTPRDAPPPSSPSDLHQELQLK